jgi:uncharacterized membrane protein YbhN (UPF0104 family)
VTKPAVVFAVLLLSIFVGSATATPSATDPIQGVWKITRGGTGTIAVVSSRGIFAVTAKSKGRLGERPSRTRLPKGVYSANFGPAGIGCNYAVRLRRTGSTLVGKVLYSEENQPGGPFTFRRA